MDFLSQALSEARLGLGRTSPNPAVGAVVVNEGVIVGRGHHIYAAQKHAEVVALEEAGERSRGAALYVTLEPCAHTGRTGPCAQAIIDAGVKHVIAAMEDPNPMVAGRGFEMLRAAGVQVMLDPRYTAEAESLNEAFCFFMRERRPLVTLKSAVTLDGKIAAPDDNTGWITSEQARLHVQTLRHLTDSILTGIGTVLADNCLLTDRSGEERSRPLLRIVLDSQLRLPPHSHMVETCSNDVLVVTTSAASAERRAVLERRGVEVVVLDAPDGRTSLRAVVELLASRNYLSLMIEAGSKVNWTALESGITDKIFFYYAPKILGGMQSLPVAGGIGRRRRADAVRFRNLKLHPISSDEFAVEAWMMRPPRQQ